MDFSTETKTEEDVKTLKKDELIENGLHLDWLVRARDTNSLETLIYLSNERQKWAHEDQKLILTILQDYEKSVGSLIPENDPPQFKPIQRKSRRLSLEMDNSNEPSELFEFTCQLFELVKNEPTIWDKQNCAQFGYHQPMRQSWCSISLKLGGWGAMQHVHMIKQLYRRKRDQYNIDYLRHGKPFAYAEQLSFLTNLLEMTKGESSGADINLEDHIKASAAEIDYENEILAAPEFIQNILNEVSERIDKISEEYPPEVLAEYLSTCCNELVQNREDLATSGLHDEEWIDPSYFTMEDFVEEEGNDDSDDL